jgi:hypothetical protein
MGSPHLSPKHPPTRLGSIIVYDDQPMWNLPKEFEKLPPPSITPQHTDGRLNRQNSTESVLKYWEPAKIYKPPVFSSRYQDVAQVSQPVVKDTLVIDEFEKGKISTVWINMMKQGLSEWIRIPVIIARGYVDG